MPEKPSEEEKFTEEIDSRIRRKKKNRAEGEHSFWESLGMVGTIGWMIMLPTVAGIFLGRFIEERYETRFSWTLSLMILGLAMGCYNAWRMIQSRKE